MTTTARANQPTLTAEQLAQIFAPEQLGLHTRGDWQKMTNGCQRLIDHYTTAGQYNSPALVLAIICKHLIANVQDLERRYNLQATDAHGG